MTKLIEQINRIREQLDDMERMIMDNVVKLPWDEAPEWAQWAAMDADGEWWWYQAEPEVSRILWRHTTGLLCRFDFPPCTNWKESKRRRS